MNIERLRQDFEIFKRKINGKPIIYFDNAATTQKPKPVLDAINHYYTHSCANIHRGIHKLSQEASELYEEAHRKVGKFINAKEEQTIFTRNTTESLNLIYYSYGWRKLVKGDEVITTMMEHHSNIVPLLELKKLKGVEVKYIEVNKDGTLKMEEYDKISDKTKIVTVTHCSNVLGTINDVKEIGKMAHRKGALFIVDGAQSVPHMDVDFKKIDADFLAFSGHKMLGPAGIGALIGKKDILEKLDPFLFGGDMIQEVKVDSWKVNKLPWKFEAGTPNINGGIGFGAGADYLSKLGMDNVREHEKELIKYALDGVQKIDNIEIYGSENAEIRGGVLSFNVKGLNCHSVAGILNSMNNIMCRSGMLCAQPLVETLNKDGVVRASFYIYNTKEEIDIFLDSLRKITKGFK